MGCSVTARKPAAGASPLQLGPKAEVSESSNTNPLAFLLRVLLGSVGGALACGVCLWLGILGRGGSSCGGSLLAVSVCQSSSRSCSPVLCCCIGAPSHCCHNTAAAATPLPPPWLQASGTLCCPSTCG